MAQGKKTGGRKKGSVNLAGKPYGEMLHQLLAGQLQQNRITEALDKLQGKEYIELVLKLSAWILPAPQLQPEPVAEQEEEIKVLMNYMPIGTPEEVAHLRSQSEEEARLSRLLFYPDKKYE